MLDTLVEMSRKQGIRNIFGYYYPTSKNAMVRELFASFGFTKMSENAVGETVWSLKTDGYINKNSVIKVN